jgi:hypothetical protein
MPYGKGTYGSKVGRPPKKKTGPKALPSPPRRGSVGMTVQRAVKPPAQPKGPRSTKYPVSMSPAERAAAGKRNTKKAQVKRVVKKGTAAPSKRKGRGGR